MHVRLVGALAAGSAGAPTLRVNMFDGGRNDANVAPELEDQVVDIGRCHGTQDGQFCSRLLVIEHVSGQSPTVPLCKCG
jgi:hypothetical protein